MPLTQKARQRILETLKNTRVDHGAMSFPEACYSFRNLCREETIEFAPVVGHSFKVYRFTAKNKSLNCPLHINIHGGGFIYGHAENDALYSAYLADAIGGIVLDVDYTTSDRAPFPVALHQCYAVAKYARAKASAWDADTRRISVGGYSAGGILTAGVALMTVERREFQLCLQVLGYPPLDSGIDFGYKRVGAHPMMPLERQRAFNELYFDGALTCTDPLASPLHAGDEALRQLPRTLICTAAGCDLRFEDEDYAIRLATLGVEVTFKRFPGTRHGFIPHFMAGWRNATELIVQTIRSASLGDGMDALTAEGERVHT